MNKPTKPCYACGADNWGTRPGGGWGCDNCHPGPPGVNVHTPEVLALRDRVILGNKKLSAAFEQLKGIADDQERWSGGMERVAP